MLILFAPLAVGVLNVVATAAKQWRAGDDIKKNDTIRAKLLLLQKEWDGINEAETADDVRSLIGRGLERWQIAEPALRKGGEA